MKKYLWFILLLVIIIILIGILIFFLIKNNFEQKLSYIEEIEIKSPKANKEILSPLKITGKVNGNGWAGFEGQVGRVELLDNNGYLISSGILFATTDWMKFPVEFETILDFYSYTDQSGSLIFYNENPSDMREKDKKIILPVKIKKSSGESMKIKIYFNNSQMDPEYSCNKVFAIEREVPKTEAVAKVAIEELLKGPTDVEKDLGFFTNINKGVKIQNLRIENETAYIDFNEQLQYQVGGSCRVSAIRSQIEETLKQFLTVKNVIISINKNTEEILQP